MASSALDGWRGTRATRLAQLDQAHQRIRTPGPGRKWETDQLNQAIMLRLAAEFQGYCRDLHTECAEAIVAGTYAPRGSPLETTIRNALIANRKLDRGNANPGNLGDDFAQLGMTLWPDLHAHSRRAATWNQRLDLLNTARNGIAHDDRQKLATVRSAGWPLTLDTARKWQRTLDATAAGMDTVCRQYLTRLLGVAPWRTQ